jgi:hypothetical protein
LATHAADACRQIGKAACFGDRNPDQTDRFGGQDAGQHHGGKRVKPMLDRDAMARKRVETGVSAYEPIDHRCEQRLFAGESSVDGRLASWGDLGDFVDARALEAVFEKNTARCIENSLLDPAGVFARRAAITHSASPSPTFFLDGVRFHRSSPSIATH